MTEARLSQTIATLSGAATVFTAMLAVDSMVSHEPGGLVGFTLLAAAWAMHTVHFAVEAVRADRERPNARPRQAPR